MRNLSFIGRHATVLQMLKPEIRHHTLSEQIAHSTVDLHLKEISEFLHCSVMNKDFTLP